MTREDVSQNPGCWKALGFNAHNRRIEILGDGLHVIAIDCSEELFEYFDCGFHASNSSSSSRGGTRIRPLPDRERHEL